MSVGFDVNVLVLAVAVEESPFRSWRSTADVGEPECGLLGVINDAAEFVLWLSPHILTNTGRVLATVLKTPDEEVDDYLRHSQPAGSWPLSSTCSPAQRESEIR